MTTSREVLAQLLAGGMTKAEVARAVGRDSSVMSQIERGAKPYANLTPSLEALRAQQQGRKVSIPEAPRRTTKTGGRAAVRQKTKYADGRVIRIKRQAVKSGGRSVLARLRQAAAHGLRVAFTVSYPTYIALGKSGGRDNPAGEGVQNIDIGHGGRQQPPGQAEKWVERVEAAGGDVGRALSDYIQASGLGETDGVTPLAVELRTWA